MSTIDHIHHVGIIPHDFEKICTIFEHMGFFVTPFSEHTGAMRPGVAQKPLGSGNRCVMQHDSFLEILGSTDRTQPSERILGFTSRFQGAQILCFGTSDIDGVEARLNANGISNSGVLPLQRNVQTPNGEETLRVKRLRFAEAQTEEGYIQVAETLTPEYLFLPHFVKHTNGVLRLGRVSLLAHDWKSKAELYKGFVGIGYEPSEHGAIFQINPTVQLEIVGAAFAPKVLARSLIPPIPAIAAITYVVSDLGLPVKALDDAGIPYTLLEKRVVVPAEEAGGVAVIFELA